MQVHLPLPQTGSSISLPDELACCPKDLLSLLAGIKLPHANSRRNLSLFCTCGYQKRNVKQFFLIADTLHWPEIVEKAMSIKMGIKLALWKAVSADRMLAWVALGDVH